MKTRLLLSFILTFACGIAGLMLASPVNAQNNNDGNNRILREQQFSPQTKAQLQKLLKAGMNTSAQVIKSNKSMPASGAEVMSSSGKNNALLGNPAKPAVDPSTLPGVPMINANWYEFQTNGAMPERLAYYKPSETEEYIQAFWMADETDPNWGQRGTYFDIATIDQTTRAISMLGINQRIETTPGGQYIRTGWPSMMQFNDGGVATASHNPATSPLGHLLFTKNGEFAGSSWATSTMIPQHGLWPRNVVDGAGVIHAIYTYDTTNTDTSKWSEVLYTRSTDGGTTWAPEKLMSGWNAFDGPQAAGEGGDTYVLTARGNEVIIGYQDSTRSFVYRKSMNNGVTWTAPTAIYLLQHTAYYPIQDNGNGTAEYTSDTIFMPGVQMDIIIDSKGTAHFVCGMLTSFTIGTGDFNGGVITNPKDSLVYSFISTYFGLGYQYENSGQSWELFGLPGGIDTTSIPAGTARPSSRFAYSLSQTPQLGLDAQDNLYCAYSGIVQSDATLATFANNQGQIVNEPGLNGHLYITQLITDGQHMWSDPKNITPDGVDCRFTTLCNEIITSGTQKWMYLAYSADDTPGDRVTDTTLASLPGVVMVATYPTDQLNPSLNKIQDVNDPTAFSGDISMTIMPNPVQNIANLQITMNNDARERATIDLFDVLGRKVMSVFDGYLVNGNTISLKAQGLQAGVYYCTLTTRRGRITANLTITH